MNDHNDMNAEDAFAGKAKQLFDESVQSLDGEARSRLNRGRQAALAELEHRRPAWLQWAPAAGVTAAAVFAVLLWTDSSEIENLDTPVATDLEILLTEDSLEMLEDLEFYSWIDFEEQASDSLKPANNVG